MRGLGRGRETDEAHFFQLWMRGEKVEHGAHRDDRGLFRRVAVHPGGNGGKGDAPRARGHRFLQGSPVGRGEERGFAVVTATPHRPHSVDDKAGRQTKARRDFGVASGAAAQWPAGRQQFGTGRPMNGSVHAAAPQQTVVRRVDNGVHLLAGDVALLDFQTILHVH